MYGDRHEYARARYAIATALLFIPQFSVDPSSDQLPSNQATMRFANTFVATVVAVLFASGNALSAAMNSHQATVSKMELAELGTSINAIASESKRYLRSDRTMDDDEERYQYWKIQDLKQGKWSRFFNKWRDQGKTSSELKAKLLKANKFGLTKGDVDTIVTNYKISR